MRKIKYRPTPLNITCALLILAGVYSAVFSGPMGFGLIITLYSVPAGLFGLWMDYLIQKFNEKYWHILLIELVMVAMMAIPFLL